MNDYRIGIDENGLGARLGPLIVTAAAADVDEAGARLLRRKLPQRLRADLDDSKRLVSCHDTALGEAWARALVPATTPAELFASLSLEGLPALQQPCPRSAHAQCWSTTHETFAADEALLARVQSHVDYLAQRGVRLRAVRSSVVCVRQLNELKDAGVSRFSADLHAMERLVLDARARAGRDVNATCGKVGGIGDYGRFFGPLSGRLHSVLVERREESAYAFPGLGVVRFLKDADASDPLVMLASLVGKYVRELLMGRIGDHWRAQLPELGGTRPSGYHDPVTARFFDATALARAARRVPLRCFERTAAEATAKQPRAAAKAASRPRAAGQRPPRTLELFAPALPEPTGHE